MEQSTDTPTVLPTSETTPMLFIETPLLGTNPTPAHVIRARFVKINSAWLLDGSGEPRNLPPDTEIQINLFPDLTYTGVIHTVSVEDGVITWHGPLKDVDTSEMTLVYTSGVFIGHFASPQGVYEVSSVGNDLYQIIQIDQKKLPGGQD